MSLVADMLHDHHRAGNHIVCPNSEEFAITTLRWGRLVCSQCGEDLFPFKPEGLHEPTALPR